MNLDCEKRQKILVPCDDSRVLLFNGQLFIFTKYAHPRKPTLGRLTHAPLITKDVLSMVCVITAPINEETWM